jgi:peptidoglycan/xylan/chitin deacetylase (PgdA/CDA1 family)
MVILPILTYHSIDRTGSCLSTTPEVFDLQMKYLASRHYRTLTVTEAVSCLKHVQKSTRPIIALTFDDGYRSTLELALPVLRKHGFIASLFAVSGFCGAENAWDPAPGPIPRFPIMSAEEIRELTNAGWEIGAHTVNHVRLTSLADEALKRELCECRLSLQESTGEPVKILAYPYGAHDAGVRSQARVVFDAACTTELDFATSASDPLALPRIDAFYLRTPAFFRSLETRWMPTYLALRRRFRKVRAK